MTMLECEVAVILLSLLLVGMVKLIGAHERLVSSLDEWTVGEPTYWVHLPQDELRRVLGVPARLDTEPPSTTEKLLAALPEGPDAVVVEQVESDLAARSVRATVRRVPAVPATASPPPWASLGAGR